MRSIVPQPARRLLGWPDIVHRASHRPPAVALTFDDGPALWTLEVADALESHGCRGTFFLLGAAVERQPETVAALAAAGHELGSHLWSHSDPMRQSRAAIRAELDRTAQAIARSGARAPVLVRPPYCGAPDRVARAARRSEARLLVLRSVDPADWNTPSADEIVERVLTRVQPGDVVCLHDGIAPNNRGTPTRAPTVAAVRRLVPELLRQGLRPVTVSELLA